MRPTFITTVAALALTVGISGFASAQSNPATEDTRPAGARVERHAPADDAGAGKRVGQAEPAKRDEQAKPGQAEKRIPEKRMDEKRAVQAERADNRVDEKKAGQAEPTDRRLEKRADEKRVDEKRADQADTATKRIDNMKSVDEKRIVDDKRIDEKRIDEKRLGAAEKTERRDENSARARAAEVRVQGNVHISQERAVHITDEIIRRGGPEHLNVAIEVGGRLPEEVTLRALPPEIVEIAPEYRGYDYVYADDRIVFVEPTTHEVIGMIDTGGNAVAANDDQPRLSRAKPCPID